jgi:UDP-N-acetylmuramoyl-tripeptide--D-alanyl-D-alanine ligase
MSFFQPDTLRATTTGRWLRRPEEGARIRGVGTDTRTDLAGMVFVAIRGPTHDGHAFLAEAASGGSPLLIIERESAAADVPADARAGILLVEGTRQALARLAAAYRRTLANTRVIAVTGSAGKTTTKMLIDGALATTLQGTASPKSFNNDIGVPLTLLAARPTDKYVVVEIGTNAPGEVGQLAAIVEPDIAVITLVGRSHLQGLGSVEAVAREKASLLVHLREGGAAVVNADLPILRDKLRSVETRILFGESEDADLRLSNRGRDLDPSAGGSGRWWFEVNGRTRFELGLPGRHNAINALAAVAVARRLGVPDEAISRGLGAVTGAPMRMTIQTVGTWTIYNDAYNANPDSVTAALETFAELAAAAKRRVVILGDMLELGEAGPELHREIGHYIATIDRRVRIDHAMLIGPLAASAAAALRETWPPERVTVLPEIGAVTGEIIRQRLRPRDAILLKGSRGTAMERLVSLLEHHRGKAPKARTPAGHREKARA